MEEQQRVWLYGELRKMPQRKRQIEALEDTVDRLKGDIARLTSPTQDITREKVQGGRNNPLEIQYLSKKEQVDRIQARISELRSKLDFMTSCLDSLSEQEKSVIELDVQKEFPRWRTIEEMGKKYGERYYSKRIQRIKSEALEQLSKLLLGVMA